MPPLFRSQSSRSSGGAGAGAARPARGGFDPANVLVKREPGLEQPEQGTAGDNADKDAPSSDEEGAANADDRDGGFGRGGGGGGGKRRRLAGDGPSARAHAHHASLLPGFSDAAAPSMTVGQWDTRLRMLDRFAAQGVQLPQSVLEHLIHRIMAPPEEVDYDASQVILACLCRLLSAQPQALLCTSAHVHLLFTLTAFVDATFDELLAYEMLPPAAARQAAELHVASSLPAAPTLHERMDAARRVSALVGAVASSRDRALAMLRQYLLVHRLFLSLFLEDARMTQVYNQAMDADGSSSGSSGHKGSAASAAAASSSSSSSSAAAFAPSGALSRELASLSSKSNRRAPRGGARDPRDESCALFACFQLHAREGEKLFDWRLRLKAMADRLQTYLSDLAESERSAESAAVPSELVSEWLMYVRAGWLELVAQMDKAKIN